MSAGASSDEALEQREAGEGRREVAEYALLGLLREGPRHGYALAAAFRPEGRLGVALRLKMSQMYAYLRKLERQGLLVAREEAAPDARRPRHVFTLTTDGERAFDEWLAMPVRATREVRLAFLVKLAFALRDPSAALALVVRQRAATSAWLERQRATEGRLAPATVDLAGTPATGNEASPTLARLTLRQRILLSEAALAWLDEARALLTATAPGGA